MNLSIALAPTSRVRILFPGVLACGVIAAAATFLSEHYHAPVMLFALLLGIAMNFMSTDSPCAPGVAFTSSTLLRCGVALLGLRITLGEVTALGWPPIVCVLLGVVLTIGVSIAAARALGFPALFGLLSGGATAICGASAALALSAAMPGLPQRERWTSFTIIGVSALSTLAMVIYPIIARAAGLDDTQAGVFLGATIHDVAQVVGAGYSMSNATGDTGTVVKLMRVAMLLPVIAFTIAFLHSRSNAPAGERPPLLPWFVLAFAALVAINSAGWLPRGVVSAGSALSGWFLVASIAAIGVKTQLQELTKVGLRPALLLVAQTLFLALLILGLLRVLAVN